MHERRRRKEREEKGKGVREGRGTNPTGALVFRFSIPSILSDFPLICLSRDSTVRIPPIALVAPLALCTAFSASLGTSIMYIPQVGRYARFRRIFPAEFALWRAAASRHLPQQLNTDKQISARVGRMERQDED